MEGMKWKYAAKVLMLKGEQGKDGECKNNINMVDLKHSHIKVTLNISSSNTYAKCKTQLCIIYKKPTL